MPELPEVETVRRGIEPHLVGQRVVGIDVHNPRLRHPVPKEVERFVGEEILSVERRAKYLLIKSTHYQLIFHLGMSGVIRVLPSGSELQKHDHIVIELSSGQSLIYNDPRRFGFLLIFDLSETPSFFGHLAPEPLSDEFTAEILWPKLRNRTRAIKTILMDQAFVVGAGNIYANESLFMAGIRPTRPANKVTKKELVRLVDAVKKVLARAIEQGGTTLKDFTTPDGQPGYFAQELLVYGQKEAPCVVCGSEIKRIVLAQRATYYCKKCQK